MEGILEQILQELKLINKQLHVISTNTRAISMNTKTSESLPDAVTVEDIKSYLNIGANQAYAIINCKEFTRVNLGRKICIPKEQFVLWVEREWRKKRIGISI
jgi:hypothetical protein